MSFNIDNKGLYYSNTASKQEEWRNTKSKTSVISNAKFISNTFGLNSMHEIATVLQNKYLHIVGNYNTSFTITVLCYNLKIIKYYDNTSYKS